MARSVRECPEGFGILTGIFFRKVFLLNYDTNSSEILHNYCLHLSEDLLLCSGPKYAEFPEKFGNSIFYGILVISLSVCMNIDIFALIALL